MIENVREASISRILLRFNYNPGKLKIEIDDINKVVRVKEYDINITMVIPMYMLHNSEVFRLVHSYITKKLEEHKGLN